MFTRVDPRTLKWVHKPELYIVKEDRIVLETEPYTDIIPSRKGAEAIQMALVPKGNFCFTMRVDYKYHAMFDQCGLILYKGDERKMILSTQYRNNEVQRLQSTVFYNGSGDRSVRDIGTAIDHMYYRIWYRRGACTLQYSFNGKVYTDLRKFMIQPLDDLIYLGIFACSPGDSYFDCTFSNMTLEEHKEETKK